MQGGKYVALIKSDSLTVIQMLKKADQCLDVEGNIVDPILVLSEGFQTVQFIFVPRVCNLVAGSLAKKAYIVYLGKVDMLEAIPGLTIFCIRTPMVFCLFNDNFLFSLKKKTNRKTSAIHFSLKMLLDIPNQIFPNLDHLLSSN